MPWAKLDDGFALNPKIEAVSAAAVGVYTMALTECARRLTDGVITPRSLGVIMVGREDSTSEIAAELVEAGLWHSVGEGSYRIPDYLEFNLSAEEVKAERAKNRERQQRKRAMSRRDTPRDDPPDDQGESQAPNPTQPNPTQPPSGSTQQHSSPKTDAPDNGGGVQTIDDALAAIRRAKPDVDEQALRAAATAAAQAGHAPARIVVAAIGGWPTTVENPTGMAITKLKTLAKEAA